MERPQLEVTITATAVIASLAVGRVKKEDLDIHVDGMDVTIRRRLTGAEDEWTFTAPSGSRLDRAKAACDSGILKIKIPREEAL